MRHMRSFKSGALVAALGLVVIAAGAQQSPPQQAPPQTPPFANPPGGPPQAERPLAGPEYLRLAFLVGAWDEAITYGGAENATGTGHWVARPLMGFYLMINYQGRGPEGPYRAQGVLTYDRDAQQYRMWWFDDTGGIGDYRGNFTDANTLVLEHQGKKEGRDFRERITYRRVAPGEVRTKIEEAWDTEEYKTALEAVARRGAGAQMRQGRGPGPPQ